MFPFVTRMHLQRLLRPARRGAEVVVLLLVEAEVVGQFAADDALLEKRLHRLLESCLVLDRLDRGALCAQLTEVVVRRQVGERL